MLFYGMKFLHLLAMAVWIGAAAGGPMGMRRSLALGGEQAREFVGRLEGVTKLIVGAALVTVITGLALVELSGGWGKMPRRIYLGTGLTLGVIVIGATAASRRLGRCRRILRPGATVFRRSRCGGGLW